MEDQAAKLGIIRFGVMHILHSLLICNGFLQERTAYYRVNITYKFDNVIFRSCDFQKTCFVMLIGSTTTSTVTIRPRT